MSAPVVDLTENPLHMLAAVALAPPHAPVIDLTASSTTSTQAPPFAPTPRITSVKDLLNAEPSQEASAATGSKRKNREEAAMQPPPKRAQTDAAATAHAGESSTASRTTPLTADALAALEQARQPARAASSARAVAPLPSQASILRFDRIPASDRVREFGRLAADISAAINPSAVRTHTKEKMCEAVLDLAGQAQHLKPGNERVEAFKLIDGLVRRLPRLEGQPAAEFHAEYTRLRQQLLPPNFVNLNRSFGTGSA